MRSTSAAPASSIRARGRAAAAAPSAPLLASIAIAPLLVAMVSQPARQEAFPSFLRKDLVHKAMILGTVAGNTIQNKAAELEREGPLAHFPQFVVVLPLRPHDGDLVDRRVIEADLAINGPNGRCARLGIRHVKAHGTGFEEQRADLRQASQLRAKDVTQGVRHKA